MCLIFSNRVAIQYYRLIVLNLTRNNIAYNIDAVLRFGAIVTRSVRLQTPAVGWADAANRRFVFSQTIQKLWLFKRCPRNKIRTYYSKVIVSASTMLFQRPFYIVGSCAGAPGTVNGDVKKKTVEHTLAHPAHPMRN